MRECCPVCRAIGTYPGLTRGECRGTSALRKPLPASVGDPQSGRPTTTDLLRKLTCLELVNRAGERAVIVRFPCCITGKHQ
jgi:hypothetical protein